MARKKTRRKPTAKKTQSPAWLWLLTGILIGLGASTWAVLQGYIPQPKQSAESKQELPTPNKNNAKDAQAILDGGDKGKAAKKPHYDFFTVLEEVEVAVPEKELRQQAKTEAKQPVDTTSTKKTTTKGGYIIQVGSFRNPTDAESMKAQLAFLGATAHIQKVTINDKSWQRVRVGPFNSASEVESMRKRLSSNGIDSKVYQVK